MRRLRKRRLLTLHGDDELVHHAVDVRGPGRSQSDLCLPRHPPIDRQLGTGKILSQESPGLDLVVEFPSELALLAAKVAGEPPHMGSLHLEADALGVQLHQATGALGACNL